MSRFLHGSWPGDSGTARGFLVRWSWRLRRWEDVLRGEA